LPAPRKHSAKLASNAALVVIDVQRAWDDPSLKGRRNNPAAEERMAQLLAAWRRTARPIFHVKHDSKSPTSPFRKGEPGNPIKEEVRPLKGEPVISKDVNSAFIGTDFERRLRRKGIKQVVFVGISTDHCVSTTVRMANNLGFDSLVVSDATAACDRVGSDGKKFDAQLIHETSLASLNGQFAEIVDSRDLLKRL